MNTTPSDGQRQPFDSVVIGRRYNLHGIIGEGGMGIVYRSLDRLTGRIIALKRVYLYDTAPRPQSALSMQPRPHTLESAASLELDVALAHEFQLLASLRHPNIISVLDYGFDAERQPYFTMDLLESSSTIVEAGRNHLPNEQADLLIQLLRALDYLHRRGVIHCDLKPANVLVIGKQVKVLDFGLAARVGESTADKGSILYMAPETIENGKISVASDLYAVGTIAYEMINGQVPFLENDIEGTLDAIYHQPPDLDPTHPLTPIISQLLAKDAVKRPISARTVIAALGHLLDTPQPIETAAVRESFLQSARFVGRAAEMNQLLRKLRESLVGNGTALLVGGESGVGKSRLLDELAIHASVDGIEVVRSHAEMTESSPYQMWRLVLRWLCLTTDLTDAEASVLKAFVPDIAEILKRPIPDAAYTDPQSAQARFLNIVLDVLKRQEQPLVVLLEDIHWANEESLALLAYLSSAATTLPIFLVASYRDDEKPQIPASLPAMGVLTLHRFNKPEVAQFAELTLGAAGQQPALLDVLYQETEGNAYFLVEVLRALIEEAGELDAISQIPLPEHIFTGGIQSVVQRRLSRVLPDHRRLLKLAAVSGRQLDLTLLTALEPSTNLDRWLTAGQDVAVLEIRDSAWRFAHDKLREGLLINLAAAERIDLHERVAVALEALHPDDDDYAAMLAYQWGEAGDIYKQIRYLVRAGDQAIYSSANRMAMEFLGKALSLASAHSLPNIDRAYMALRLSDAYMAQGMLDQSIASLDGTLTLLGHPRPSSHGALVRHSVRQLGIQLAIRLNIRSWLARREQSEQYRYLAEAYKNLGRYYYFLNDTLPSISATLTALNYAERSRIVWPVLSTLYASVAMAAGLLRYERGANFYVSRAQDVAHRLKHPKVIMDMLSPWTAYTVGIGKWDELKRDTDDGKRIAASLSDGRSWRSFATQDANRLYLTGKFAESSTEVKAMQESALRDGDNQFLTYGVTFQSAALLRLGKLDDAAALLLPVASKDYSAMPKADRPGRVVNVFGLLSLLYFYRDEYDQARQAIETLVNEVTSSAVNVTLTSGVIYGYAACLEACLGLREQAPRSDEALRALSLSLLGAFRKYCQRFPIGLPCLLRSQGLIQWFDGKQSAAFQSWSKSIREAHRLDMPFEEALTLAALGRHTDPDDPHAQEALSKAGAIFDQLEVPQYRTRYAIRLSSNSQQDQDKAHAGIAIYSNFVLVFYDLFVLGFSNLLAWRCPTPRIIDFYNEHITARHLDIGVGTGYLLDKCKFPTDKPELALMDLNPNSLREAAKRLSRYQPTTYVANVLEPLSLSTRYDSVSLGYLLHCLPGTLRDKAVVFQNIRQVLNPGGVVFGTTILGQGIKPNPLARLLMSIYNSRSVFSNQEDNVNDLEAILKDNFSTHKVWTIGCVAFFMGRM